MSVVWFLLKRTPLALLYEVFWADTVIAVKLEHQANAWSPILVTLLGIVTVVRVELKKASFPMPVTVRPLIVLGMANELGTVPVYPVMTSPPLPSGVVVNWARAAAGKISNSSRAKPAKRNCEARKSNFWNMIVAIGYVVSKLMGVGDGFVKRGSEEARAWIRTNKADVRLFAIFNSI